MSPEEIRTEAERFISKYNPDRDYPISIEEIVEFDLRIQILPIQNLKSSHKAEAFIYSNFSTIVVDETQMGVNPNRYRFTLAHEVGHYWIHPDEYKKLEIEGIEDWAQKRSQITNNQLYPIETCANMFAGMVLAPLPELIPPWEDSMDRLAEMNWDPSLLSETQWNTIYKKMGETLEVSAGVIKRRVAHELQQGNIEY